MTTTRTDQDTGGAPEPAAGSPVEPALAPGAATTRGRLVLRRFRRNRLALAGLLVIVLLYGTSFLGPAISPWTYDSLDYDALLSPPSPAHWFGTTQIGGDMFVQTMRGLQKSLTIGLLVGVISTSVAAAMGAAAGYFGGWTDRALMWLVDLLLVMPSFLILAILSPALQRTGWLIFVAALAAFSWMITARIVRGMTLSLREREFVKAARFMGESPWRIIARHILPNMASLLIIDATVTVSTAVLTETGLSFFGFGVQPPDVSLGTLIRDGTQSALTTPWLFLPAGILLIVSVLAVNFVGDGLRDALDPTSARGRRRDRRAKATGQDTVAAAGGHTTSGATA
jgi:peptide/nickel transport system permease protein